MSEHNKDQEASNELLNKFTNLLDQALKIPDGSKSLRSTSMEGTVIPDENEQPEDNSHGHLVPLIWEIEKLRINPHCSMNELLSELKKQFTGFEHIKHRTKKFNGDPPDTDTPSAFPDELIIK